MTDPRTTATRRPDAEVGQIREPARTAWWRAARLWAVVVCFIGVGIARSARLGIPFRDPHGAYLVGRVALTSAIFLGLVALDGLVRTDHPRSVRRGWSTVRARWTWGRVALAWTALLAYHATYFTYHNLKSWDVFNAPRDAMLTAWDHWLFLGHSPAVLLHDLLGQQAAAWVLMVWYEAFATLVVVAFPAAVVLAPRMRDAYAGIAAFVWVWILGTATYYAIPSLGPFHAEPGDFSGLPHLPVQDTQADYLAQRDHLLAHPHAPDAFAQVSAFASLHVAVTATILGLAWWHRMRRTTVVLAVFLAGTMVATVYLGWHFAVDLPAGLAIAALAWVLGPLTVGVRRRPPRAAGRRSARAGDDAR
ncbi:phosphatase PAP2 family protein [Nocardioides soli]|uniref:Membrane-associated phospholipid phosphatase n=1 Tax=Nocardioides soli TaxID=1036020 RepID=A0A7W4VT55_9ACTN|nr:membrane-associated phospholipid phosphatase [Nocardioides soli]